MHWLKKMLPGGGKSEDSTTVDNEQSGEKESAEKPVDVIALYERAESLVSDGRLAEAAIDYQTAFEQVRNGQSADDKSRAGIFASKLSKLYIKLQQPERAEEFSRFLQGTSASKTPYTPGPPELAALTGVAIDRLSNAGLQSNKIDTSAQVQTPGGTRITFSLECRRHKSWLYIAVGVERYYSPGGVVLEKLPARQTERMSDGLIEEMDSCGSLGKALATVKSKCTGATLLPGSIIVKSSKASVPGKELKRIAVDAWCEAFGVQSPSDYEMKELEAAEKAKKTAQAALALSELSHGSAGISRWNLLPLQIRKAVQLSKADFSKLDLTGVKLFEHELAETTFKDATLKKSLFSQCDLKSVSFAGACLDEARFATSTCEQVNFAGASMRNGFFAGTRLVGTNFQGADLQHTLFTGDHDDHMDRLTNVDFTGANLTGARFAAVEMSGVNFRDANLTNVVFANSKYDGTTVFPPNFSGSAGLTWTGSGPDPFKAKQLQQASPTVPIDFKTFLTLMEKTMAGQRVEKAMEMLKEERFQLFCEVTNEYLLGVVKSQSDPDLLYSCRLAANGQFFCCTQNLNRCGGLKDTLCKHLLVLIIGLVRKDKLDPNQAEQWARMSRACRPEFDKELMADAFLRYKGAEAGEIDWRPTETTPEDYYAF